MNSFVCLVFVLFHCFHLDSCVRHYTFNAMSNSNAHIKVPLQPLPNITSSVYLQKTRRSYWRLRASTIATFHGTTVVNTSKNYYCRIFFTGNTVNGNIEFTLKNVSAADAAHYLLLYRPGNYRNNIKKNIYLVIDGKVAYADKGSTAVLKLSTVHEYRCVYDDLIDPYGRAGRVTFSRLFGFMHIRPDYFNSNKYSVTAYPKHNYIEVEVQNVSVADEGTYAFQCGLDGATLITYVTPEKPVIVEKTKVVPRSPLTLNCESRSNTVPAGYDAIPMYSQWFVGDKKITNSTEYTIAFSSLKIREVDKEDIFKRFYCQVQESSSTPSVLSDKYTINVKFPPLVSLLPAIMKYTLIEGDNMDDITCFADCFPGCKNVVWMTPFGDNVTSSVLSLGKLAWKDRGSYSCVASNSAGKDMKTIYINIKNATTIAECKAFSAGIAMIIISLLLMTGTICAVLFLKFTKVFVKTENSMVQRDIAVTLSNIKTLYDASENASPSNTSKVDKDTLVSEIKK